MKITGYGPISSVSNSKKTGKTSASGGFSELLAAAESDETAQAGPVGDVAATTALNNMLALQEISEEDIRRKKLAQQGKNLLDVLERLRQQLLMGTLPYPVLLDLSRNIALKKQFVNDPRLNEVIADIELRAAVELAKLEKALGERGGESSV